MALNKNNQDQDQDQDQDQNKPSQNDLTEQNKLLQAQVMLYQEQFKQSNDATEQSRLEQEAEKLQSQREALEQEADLRRTLGESFPREKPSADENEDESHSQMDQQQMVNTIGEAVGKAIKANSALLEGKFAEVLKSRDEKLDATQNALVKLMANMSVKEAQSAYPDFDTYRGDIGKILQSTPGLSPDDAYLLAKARKSSSQPDQKLMETERPHNALSRTDEHASRSSSERREQHEHRPRNARRDLRDAIGVAIDKTIAARS